MKRQGLVWAREGYERWDILNRMEVGREGERGGEELAWLVICFKTTTRKAHVNYSVIKSLCVCFHIITWPMGCIYLMDSEQPNKVSLLWRDGQAPWVKWGAVPTSLADGPLFHWNGQVTWQPQRAGALASTSAARGEHGAGKDRSIRHELLPATWVCVSRQGHTAPDAWLRSQGIQQTASRCLLCARLHLESSHHWKFTAGMLMGSESRTQIAAEFTLALCHFSNILSKHQHNRQLVLVWVSVPCLEHIPTTWPRLGTLKCFLN